MAQFSFQIAGPLPRRNEIRKLRKKAREAKLFAKQKSPFLFSVVRKRAAPSITTKKYLDRIKVKWRWNFGGDSPFEFRTAFEKDNDSHSQDGRTKEKLC
jgi:hypothetical protein